MAEAGAHSSQLHDIDVEELSVSKEFANAEPLLLSEVYMMLEYRRQQVENLETDEQSLTEVFQKALQYCGRYGKLKNNVSVIRMRSVLVEAKKLTKVELVSLANLCPHTPEEAVSLIPSLEGRFGKEELVNMISNIQLTIRFQA